MTKGHHNFDSEYSIFAGKFRRYHGESWFRRIIDIKTNLLNIRDFFYFLIGFFQSVLLLRKTRPEVILLKGGFVGVPVGLAAALMKIPFITHDSDAMPGLANRLVSRWAHMHATGMPVDFYRYPKEKTIHVGVLVGSDYTPVDAGLKKNYKKELGLNQECSLLFITGGSHGSVNLNKAMAHVAPKLLNENPDLFIVHQVGKGNESTYGGFKHERLTVKPFIDGMYRYSGAADVIITRAGANALAEFGIQGKACIVVPNPLLTGGHQLKNAEELQRQRAVEVADETILKRRPEALFDMVNRLLKDAEARLRLEAVLRQITIPNASRRLAELLIEVGH